MPSSIALCTVAIASSSGTSGSCIAPKVRRVRLSPVCPNLLCLMGNLLEGKNRHVYRHTNHLPQFHSSSEPLCHGKILPACGVFYKTTGILVVIHYIYNSIK